MGQEERERGAREGEKGKRKWEGDRETKRGGEIYRGPPACNYRESFTPSSDRNQLLSRLHSSAIGRLPSLPIPTDPLASWSCDIDLPHASYCPAPVFKPRLKPVRRRRAGDKHSAVQLVPVLLRRISRDCPRFTSHTSSDGTSTQFRLD